jgi:arylsulfatase
MGELDNTLLVYIAGDNGTSAEGGMQGLYNEYAYFNGVPEPLPFLMARLDDWGLPMTYPHMAAGWAIAGDTPFAWAKQVASNFGGTRNGMVVHWPKRVKPDSQVRSQFHHVIDVAPTILEAAGLPEPKVVNGTPQLPIEGVSMLYSFGDAKAAGRRKTQYFEIFGNRGIYSDGWFAGTIHRAPWEMKATVALANDKWELYDTRADFSLTNDLAASNPAKLKELQDLFVVEGIKYRVLPIDDRTMERGVAELAGRPDLMHGRKTLTLFPGMTGMSENVFINVKNKSHSIDAELDIPKSGANGVILAQGGRFGGWCLYVKAGKPAYAYNFLGLQSFAAESPDPLPEGKVRVRLDFAYDGPGLAKGGTATLTVNDKKVADVKLPHTQAIIYSADETADVGVDEATPVVEALGEGEATRFTGSIVKVTVKVD